MRKRQTSTTTASSRTLDAANLRQTRGGWSFVAMASRVKHKTLARGRFLLLPFDRGDAHLDFGVPDHR